MRCCKPQASAEETLIYSRFIIPAPVVVDQVILIQGFKQALKDANKSHVKSPCQFPGGGFLLLLRSTVKNGRFSRTYISTVAACSTNSGIWSKFM